MLYAQPTSPPSPRSPAPQSHPARPASLASSIEEDDLYVSPKASPPYDTPPPPPQPQPAPPSQLAPSTMSNNDAPYNSNTLSGDFSALSDYKHRVPLLGADEEPHGAVNQAAGGNEAHEFSKRTVRVEVLRVEVRVSCQTGEDEEDVRPRCGKVELGKGQHGTAPLQRLAIGIWAARELLDDLDQGVGERRQHQVCATPVQGVRGPVTPDTVHGLVASIDCGLEAARGEAQRTQRLRRRVPDDVVCYLGVVVVVEDGGSALGKHGPGHGDQIGREMSSGAVVKSGGERGGLM
ncbi:hypothetical protein A1Q2_00562 [Trichosporon asahii var. asahii CBS 8904]|uniref:Uncharacterized protein n=1 Tax=Trichosporon asahii var. asahii (strain CBS 8904) TaxID=1220162 RepID=K1VXC1_TRIAC|nr:hypothetical protein A1Q2_00562 [Trichosporon asahii var. asahii CBS 8904]